MRSLQIIQTAVLSISRASERKDNCSGAVRCIGKWNIYTISSLMSSICLDKVASNLTEDLYSHITVVILAID